MALIEIHENPSKKELAWFGLLIAAFFGFVGLLARYQFGAIVVSRWLWIVGIAVPAVYYAAPALRLGVYRGWLYATYPIGWIVSHLLLGAIYYLVFTPVGLLLRLFGKDPMTRTLEPAAASYWVEHRPCDSKADRYFHQY
jgi:hypothetical protein